MNGFVRKDVIKGVTFFDGEIDGKHIQSGACFIEEPLDASKGRAKGFRTVEYKTSDAEVIKPVMHLEFPISAEVQFELLTSKRGQSIVVRSIKPIEAVRAQPQPDRKAA
jgi:hypothetical protein